MSSTDLADLLWRKSSCSNGQANCVEVAAVGDGHTSVCVRDSKAAGQPAPPAGLLRTQRAGRHIVVTTGPPPG